MGIDSLDDLDPQRPENIVIIIISWQVDHYQMNEGEREGGREGSMEGRERNGT